MSRDELDGRIWAEHQDHFPTGLSRLARDIFEVSKRLTAHFYEAPWQVERRKSGRC